jgi:hypothetical protein
MPRLTAFDVTIKTGSQGPSELPKYSINGFELDFDEVKGGVGPGETLEATGSPDSFPHTLLLKGPATGTWQIEELRVTYHPAGEPPYTIRFGPVELDNQSDLNLWHARPLPTVQV